MMGRASISMRNLSFAVTIEKAPGIDCGLFGGYSETEPRNIMFCTLRNLSPPCAMNAAFASSSGVLSGVMTTAGAAAAGAGALLDGVVLVPPWSCATAVTAQPTKQTDKKTLFI